MTLVRNKSPQALLPAGILALDGARSGAADSRSFDFMTIVVDPSEEMLEDEDEKENEEE